METQYWAVRGKKQVGPFPTREEAIAAMRALPMSKAEMARAKAHSANMRFQTGYGTFGPHFDMRWHGALAD